MEQMNNPNENGVDNTKQPNHEFSYRLKQFLKDKFNLDEDRAQQSEVIANLERGVEVQGTNLWVLIFATFIASLGLNVNSTAVIIGAMLISPLMGPIMGIGLAVGINNFELMKRSLRNFGFMVIVSIITSTIYFTISPLSNAQSELLARTVPTTYDVLIAFFGGLAGVIAQTRQDRTSTVISGVAIATALMPPLCTAGFGLATGQLKYFFGAAYLFFINTVFIAIATYVIVRFLKYEKKVFLDKTRERTVKRYLALIVVVTLTPSVIIGYHLVKTSIFDVNADRYMKEVFNFDDTMVADFSKHYGTRGKPSTIDVMLIGEPLSADAIGVAKSQLSHYGLDGVVLHIRQANSGDNMNLSQIQKNYVELLDEKNLTITQLKHKLSAFAADTISFATLSKEASVVINNVKEISFARQIWYSDQGKAVDTSLLCMVKPTMKGIIIDREKLNEWLKVRTNYKNITIYQD